MSNSSILNEDNELSLKLFENLFNEINIPKNGPIFIKHFNNQTIENKFSELLKNKEIFLKKDGYLIFIKIESSMCNKIFVPKITQRKKI